jgi:hypothetical protein
MNCGMIGIKQAKLDDQKEYLTMSLPLSPAIFTMMLFKGRWDVLEHQTRL